MSARSRRGVVITVLAVLLLPVMAGCFATMPEPPCDARRLMAGGVAFLAATADPDGGVPARPGADPDPRSTAWALLAAGLSRRAGLEGAFDATPHVDWLVDNLDRMMQEGTPVDSVANNASLARVALQVWGRPAEGVPVTDPSSGDTTSLAALWSSHLHAASGQYGVRANEHLFAGFAAWLFGANDTLRAALADHTEALASNATLWGDAGPFAHDAWWAAYARLAVGPKPLNTSLDRHLDQVLVDHRGAGGGVRGFAGATDADGSTTAAALMAWRVDQMSATNPVVLDAVDWLCAARRDDGAVPFSAQVAMPLVKTTAEVVMAAALVQEPVPWGDPRAAA